MNALKAISLFSGAGGLDLGFEAAGFETAVAVEFDAKCAETLRANRSWPIIEEDIGHVTSKRVLETAGLCVGEADVLIGGPPCQPFSKSGFWATGQSLRFDDPRATTIDHYFRILRDTRPRAFLFENVEGLGFRSKDDGLERIKSAVADINEKIGTRYLPATAVLNAADFGVPQLRKRLFVVASRDGTPFSFPSPTHFHPSELLAGDNRLPWRTAWDALKDVPSSIDPSLNLKGKWAGLVASIPEGQNYLHHTERGAGEPLFGWRRRYWSFLLKIAKNQPAWTLQAQPGPATGPFHWANRRLSAVEMARLQTFPHDFGVAGSLADVQKQLGNAVPSLLAEILARGIREQFLGSPMDGDPSLQIEAAGSTPEPEKVQAVPQKYLKLRGVHDAHPGTGKGFRARARLA